MHTRLEPTVHKFNYPVNFYGFDLDELDVLDSNIRLFSRNRKNVVSLHDVDFIDTTALSIKKKLLQLIAQNGCKAKIARIELVTSARYFNYVFNPVNFYLCRDHCGQLTALVAEVNNTFGERHIYLLDERNRRGTKYIHSKEFHVSPFNDMSGDYEFDVLESKGELEIRVDMIKGGKKVFLSAIKGRPEPFTSTSLARTLLRYPITAALTTPRIVWQAAKLKYGKKMQVYRKPVPKHPSTMVMKQPSWFQRICRHAVLGYFSRIKKGGLEVTLPDRTTLRYGEPNAATYRMTIRDYRFFPRLAVSGDVGFGESYVAGEWTTDDLAGLLGLFANNLHMFEQESSPIERLGQFFNRSLHLFRKNTISKSRKNIQDHYDLSNDFYKLWLDDTMMYSAAMFTEHNERIETAQRRKIRRIIEQAQIQPTHHVLEIGSGWGGFAIEAARQTGCRVTTITLSEEQLNLAQKRVEEAGLEDRVEVKLQDYRHVKGHFDRIVSIEMIEAVGHQYYPTFFAECERLLKPDGIMLLQAITIPDQRYERYKNSCDWIQKHIFPGGMLPSLTALSSAATDHSRFFVQSLQNFGPDYAKTLRLWHEQFMKKRQAVEALGFDEPFIRKWKYYLCYCEAAFAARQLNVLHMVLTRAGNQSLNFAPRSSEAPVR